MYLICNHKNRLSYKEVKEYSKKLKEIDTSKIDFIVAPSLPYIYNFVDYTLASQDISAFEDEIITGELTGNQLSSLLIKYVIIGHVERRKYLKETNDILKSKVENANKNNLKVIYCFGDEGKNLEKTKECIKKDYENIKESLNNDSLLAYEPEWAIGNNKHLDYEYIKEVVTFIKNLTGKDVIYGGSVTDENVEILKNTENICGFLISSSALNVSILQNIISKIA